MSQLKELLPSWYEDIVETDVLMDVEQGLFDDLETQINLAQSNQYVSTADAKTIVIYEQMLGIVSDPLDSLELRRFRVLTRLTTQKPYTMRYLQEVLSSFGDPAELTMFYNEYRFLVEMNFEKLGQVSEIEYIFRTIVPANVLVEAQNELKAKIPKSKLYMAAGMVNTELVMITQDINTSPSIRTPMYQSLGMVVTDSERTFQDISQSPEISLNQKSGNAFINTQTIEIKERGE